MKRSRPDPAGPGTTFRPVRSAAAAALPLLLLAVFACAGRQPGEDPPGAGSASMEWAGLRVDWTLLASPADRLRVLASVRNVTDGPLLRELPWCLNRLVLYRDERAIWSRAAAEACVGVRRLDLDPGETRSFHTLLTATGVLGDSLAPGEVLVRVHLPRGGTPFLPRAEMEFTLGDKALRPE